MAWLTLSLHFKQTYDGGYRYLDKCGEFMMEARSTLNFIPREMKPTGASMDIPEDGVHATCDSIGLDVGQELEVADPDQFAERCAILSRLAKTHFRPNGILTNGFAWKLYWSFSDAPSLLAATLKLGDDYQRVMGKTLGMIPEHKKLDFMFASGSKDFRVTLEPVTFDRSGITKQNASIRALKTDRELIDRRNRFADRIKAGRSPYAILLMTDLIEHDPPESGSLKAHFNELKEKTEQAKKLFPNL